MANKMLEVKFLKNAPCGYDGYGAVATLGEKRFENFKKTGLYEMEIVKNLVANVDGPKKTSTKKKTKTSKKKK